MARYLQIKSRVAGLHVTSVKCLKQPFATVCTYVRASRRLLSSCSRISSVGKQFEVVSEFKVMIDTVKQNF